MAAPDRILELVERFERNKDEYRAPGYNEAQLRQEFLDPFLQELGWDVDNRRGWSEAYKEVIHEDSIKIGGETKAPDYCCRTGGVRKFFVEAKKPAVNIERDPDAAYQLRRYAWSAKLPLSILSDFEEFAVYDCRIRPVKTDKASKARTLFIKYDEYEDRWDEIASIFSRDEVYKGSFDRYVESTKAKRGTAEVDEAFLKEIESWRDKLARNIALRNPKLSQREINFAVQRTIDRIVFLRICEDRGIEPYGTIRALQNGRAIYKRLFQLFEQADDRYNSGLFYFSAEKGRPDAPDELSPNLKIDDTLLKEIIGSLYYPESPYEFSVLPAAILGQVYEQFLGSVIRLTAGHGAVVDQKPEVRKAGGVYYTPSYIVDYIVAETVGKLLEGKTSKQLENLRILDPACGSGSFLIGAYQKLLDWHQEWYSKSDNEPEKWARGGRKRPPRIYQGRGGEWRLTTAERKRILLANIYGVDIDSQAVEVTKLSLLLKVLEGESRDTLERQLRFAHERALPDLGSNIKCGNSLIGPDFYRGKQMSLLDEEEQYRINAFDWKREFSAIMRSGGFDAVIGNPPYIRIQTLKEWAPLEVEFYKRRYKAAAKGNYDIYVVFVERGLSLLNVRGVLGFILPHKFFNSQYGEALRAQLSSGSNVAHIVHFGHQQVFRGPTTYTCLLFLTKSPTNRCRLAKIDDLAAWAANATARGGSVPASEFTSDEWNLVIGKEGELFRRLNSRFPTLESVADVFVGLQTSADDVFALDLLEDRNEWASVRSTSLCRDVILEAGLLHPLVSGTDVNRYERLPTRQLILFPYRVINEHATLIPFGEIKERWPSTASYLSENRKRLEDRERGKFRGTNWHRFGRSQNLGIQDRVKLCVPRLVERLYAAFDFDGSHYLDNVDVGGITLKKPSAQFDMRYLLGLLNSTLLRWYFPFVAAPFRGGWLSANRQFLGKVRIRTIDPSRSSEAHMHDELVRHVDKILDLHANRQSLRAGQEITVARRRIDAVNRQIDELVYELYGLTDKEIRVVEEATA